VESDIAKVTIIKSDMGGLVVLVWGKLIKLMELIALIKALKGNNEVNKELVNKLTG
jgi:hypothetical protein